MRNYTYSPLLARPILIALSLTLLASVPTILGMEGGGMMIASRNGMVVHKPLPYDAEVEYLESTGTQWIDTGLKANETMSVQVKIAWMELGNDKPAFQSDNGSTFNGGFGIQLNNSGSSFRFVRGNQYIDVRVPPNGTWPTIDTFYDISISPSGIAVNDTLTAISDTASFTSVGTLPLFAWRRNANVIIYGKVKMGPMKIYYGSLLVRDYIPVQHMNAQGLIDGAMYDHVSGKLFHNAGTSSFVLPANS